MTEQIISIFKFFVEIHIQIQLRFLLDLYIIYYYLKWLILMKYEKKKNQKQNLIIRYNIDYLKEPLIDHTQKYFSKNHVNNIKIDKTINSH